MMQINNIVVADGAGGIMTALSFIDIYYLKLRRLWPIRLHLVCSEQVYELVSYIVKLSPYKRLLNLQRYDVNTNHEELLESLGPQSFDFTPNSFCSSKFRPPLEEWGLTWQKVKENKFLQDIYRVMPRPKKIFLGFQSSQDNIYSNLTALICELCERLPDYELNFIKLNQWSDKSSIDYGIDERQTSVYSNFNVREARGIVEDFEWILNNHDTIICTDNGLSNIAYYADKTRHVIDTRMYPAMFLRWRQTYNDLLNGTLFPDQIAKVVSLCERFPELTGMPRMMLAMNADQIFSAAMYGENRKEEINNYINQ